MLFAKIKNIPDVCDSHLCCGCGACSYYAPEALEMVDKENHGKRPRVFSGHENDAILREALRVCPGYSLAGDASRPGEGVWGKALEIWEGFAQDGEIRFAASSGGAASALALFCLEKAGMAGVLHTDADADKPWLNQTVFSRNRGDLLERAGSRYSPASPCEGLAQIENAAAKCVFIGKPCDVAAARMAADARQGLKDKLGLTISVFCASTPSTAGTLRLLKELGVRPNDRITSLRYRGNGWPGMAAVAFERDGVPQAAEMTYKESWGNILSSYAQWRCRICPDHTGEFADVAVCDPWYREIGEGEQGHSLIIARTPRGRELVKAAIAAGYITAKASDLAALEASQPNLRKARGSVWGRVVSCKLLGLAYPRFKRMPLFRNWLGLTLKEKIRSTLGTAKRIFGRKLHQQEN